LGGVVFEDHINPTLRPGTFAVAKPIRLSRKPRLRGVAEHVQYLILAHVPFLHPLDGVFIEGDALAAQHTFLDDVNDRHRTPRRHRSPNPDDAMNSNRWRRSPEHETPGDAASLHGRNCSAYSRASRITNRSRIGLPARLLTSLPDFQRTT